MKTTEQRLAELAERRMRKPFRLRASGPILPDVNYWMWMVWKLREGNASC